MSDPVSQVSILIGRLRDGETRARGELLPLVYHELEAIARAYTHTTATSLDPRGLVHELYLRLVKTPLEPRDRKHFFAIAALAMRQILVDRARRRPPAPPQAPRQARRRRARPAHRPRLPRPDGRPARHRRRARPPRSAQ